MKIKLLNKLINCIKKFIENIISNVDTMIVERDNIKEVLLNVQR